MKFWKTELSLLSIRNLTLFRSLEILCRTHNNIKSSLKRMKGQFRLFLLLLDLSMLQLTRIEAKQLKVSGTSQALEKKKVTFDQIFKGLILSQGQRKEN